MPEPRARILEFAVELDRGRTATSDRGGAPLPDDHEAWTPEHLLLTGLARCVTKSLEFHVRRAGGEVAASASARGTVTRREGDGRFAFVEIAVDVMAEIEPPLADDLLPGIVARAERDCFVGASLAVAPAYRFVVGGREVG